MAIYQYGVERVNGGFELGTTLTGQLYHYHITLPAPTATSGGAATGDTVEDHSFEETISGAVGPETPEARHRAPAGEGFRREQPIPLSALEMAYRVIATRGTPVIANVDGNELYVALENGASDWDGIDDFAPADLEAALVELGEVSWEDADGNEVFVDFSTMSNSVELKPYVLA